MGRIQKRGKGKHNPPGFIKLKIIEQIYNNISGVTTSDLREYLREEFNVREKKGIDDHLTALKEKHYIKCILEDDQENHWYPPDTLDNLLGLLSDREVWGVLRIDKKPVTDVVAWLRDNCDSVIKLFNTQFFNKTVKPQLIQNLLLSPPLLDEFNTLFGMNMKSVRESGADEKALQELYSQALSRSPTVMVHMFIPSPLIQAGLVAVQINSRLYAQLTETLVQANPEQYPFVRDQLNEVREQLQSWKAADHVPGDLFTSIEAFSLASIYVGMSIDQIQFPHIRETIKPILSDPVTNATLGKYLKNPFFSVEFMKFLIILTAVWGAFSAKK
jgi:hypothetical protein